MFLGLRAGSILAAMGLGVNRSRPVRTPVAKEASQHLAAGSYKVTCKTCERSFIASGNGHQEATTLAFAQNHRDCIAIAYCDHSKPKHRTETRFTAIVTSLCYSIYKFEHTERDLLEGPCPGCKNGTMQPHHKWKPLVRCTNCATICHRWHRVDGGERQDLVATGPAPELRGAGPVKEATLSGPPHGTLRDRDGLPYTYKDQEKRVKPFPEESSNFQGVRPPCNDHCDTYSPQQAIEVLVQANGELLESMRELALRTEAAINAGVIKGHCVNAHLAVAVRSTKKLLGKWSHLKKGNSLPSDAEEYHSGKGGA
jgi:hypothetical protein